MQKKKQSLLWEVSAPELSEKSYLFGTIHLRNKIAFANLDTVLEKIDACDSFATEFDLEDAQQKMPPDFGKLADAQTIKDFLPKKKYEKTRKMILKAFDLDIEHFLRWQPLFINSFLTEAILPSEMPLALDEHLWAYAKKQNKDLGGLETYEEQQETLQKLGIDYQLKGLLATTKNIKRYRQSLHKMLGWYEQKNIQQLYRSAKKGSGETRKFMLFERNQIMANRIKEKTKNSSLFAAIGAGHLAGGKGVLRLLKKAGFIVKPIS